MLTLIKNIEWIRYSLRRRYCLRFNSQCTCLRNSQIQITVRNRPYVFMTIYTHITHFGKFCIKLPVKMATKVYLTYFSVSGSENTVLLYLLKLCTLLFSAIYFLPFLKHGKCFLQYSNSYDFSAKMFIGSNKYFLGSIG